MEAQEFSFFFNDYGYRLEQKVEEADPITLERTQALMKGAAPREEAAERGVGDGDEDSVHCFVLSVGWLIYGFIISNQCRFFD